MWDTFKQGHCCRQCGHIRTIESQRLNEGEVRSFFMAAGYVMLGNYVDAKTHIEYSCPKGHIHSMSWSNFKRGKRCPSCARCRNADARRRKLEDVKKVYTDAGCIP